MCADAILVGRGLRNESRTICCTDARGEKRTSVCRKCIKAFACSTSVAVKTSLSDAPLLRHKHCICKQAIHLGGHAPDLDNTCGKHPGPATRMHSC